MRLHALQLVTFIFTGAEVWNKLEFCKWDKSKELSCPSTHPGAGYLPTNPLCGNFAVRLPGRWRCFVSQTARGRLNILVPHRTLPGTARSPQIKINAGAAWPEVR